VYKGRGQPYGWAAWSCSSTAVRKHAQKGQRIRMAGLRDMAENEACRFVWKAVLQKFSSS